MELLKHPNRFVILNKYDQQLHRIVHEGPILHPRYIAGQMGFWYGNLPAAQHDLRILQQAGFADLHISLAPVFGVVTSIDRAQAILEIPGEWELEARIAYDLDYNPRITDYLVLNGNRDIAAVIDSVARQLRVWTDDENPTWSIV